MKLPDELASNTDFMAVLLNTVENLVIVLDGESRIVAFNRATEKASGYAVDEIKGKTYAEVFGADDGVAQARVVPGTNRLEYPLRTRSGERKLISWATKGIYDNDGKVRFTINTGLDISARERAEEALRVSEARLNGVVTSAMDAIISINEQQLVVVFNPAAEAMFRCAANDAIGSPIERFIPERFRRGHRQQVEAFGRTGETTRSMGRLGTVMGLRCDGTEFLIEATISHFEVGGQQLYTAIMRDVTERERAERERAALQAQVLHQEKLSAVGLLASGFAHEIGNPLAAIQIICENQQRKQLDPQVAEKFQRIHDQVTRSVKIVRQLVNYARPGPDKWSRTNLNDSISSALAIAKLSRSAKTVDAQLELSENLPETWTIGDQLNQVFLNVFVNAYDALPETGGVINVRSTLLTPETIQVAIRDTGGGMSEETLKRLFTPFFTTKDVGRGTGLGLHVSEGIMRRHGGRIYAASKPNEGTTFFIEVPVRRGGEK